MTVNSVRLGPEIERRLGELAIRQQRSKSELIRQALGEYFERQAGAGQASAQAGTPVAGQAAGHSPSSTSGHAPFAGSEGGARAAGNPGTLSSLVAPLPMRVVSSAA